MCNSSFFVSLILFSSSLVTLSVSVTCSPFSMYQLLSSFIIYCLQLHTHLNIRSLHL
ncbi:hypothetical protein K492DRAFT_80124 [Lichtheimia hyalospora FSU 10163]|nr:hypothetical protein K492DRAFT_80124 [Lichtheimia hyalospora FSU 10163]